MLISFLFQTLVELVYLTFAKLNNDFEDELTSRSKKFYSANANSRNSKYTDLCKYFCHPYKCGLFPTEPNLLVKVRPSVYTK